MVIRDVSRLGSELGDAWEEIEELQNNSEEILFDEFLPRQTSKLSWHAVAVGKGVKEFVQHFRENLAIRFLHQISIGFGYDAFRESEIRLTNCAEWLRVATGIFTL